MQYLMSLYTGKYHKHNKTKVPELKKTILNNNTLGIKSSTGTHFSMNMGSANFQSNFRQRKRYKCQRKQI